MKINRILASFLVVTIMGASMPAVSVDFPKISITANAANTVSPLTYQTLEDGTIEITGCYKTVTAVEIPAEIDGKKVTSIGENAFEECMSLTAITIPDSITSIGYGAFWGCSSLTSVTIPDSVTRIGGSAFFDCSELTSITIPDSVKSIGFAAFYYTPWLENKQKENPLVIVNDILIDGTTCSGDVTVPDSVTNINSWAFKKCSGLTKITLPNSVTSIDYAAFRDCSSLTSITIPNSVTRIDGEAFYGCSELTSITIPDSVASIGYSAFYGCKSLTKITIPNGVTSIDYRTFYGCSGITSITIPDSVTSIGGEVFYGCSGLISVTIPSSVTSIGGGTFQECSSLIEITIPDGVTSIGTDMFYDCSGLTSITILNPDCKIYDSENTISNTATIYGCENSTAQAYAEKYERKFVVGAAPAPESFLKYEVLEDGTIEITDCDKTVAALVIPDEIDGKKVTSIGKEAFYDCSELTSITILNPDCKIYDSANTIINTATIYGCGNSSAQAYAEKYERKFVSLNAPKSPLKYKTLEDGTIEITGSTSAITTVTALEIPAEIDGKNVTSIGDKVFMDCFSLTEITIPDSVANIGSYAFYNCSSLTKITIPDSVTSIGKSAFSNCKNLTSITVPDSVTSIDDNVFYECNGLTSVTIPDSVTSIGSHAFSECSGLTEITIPDSVAGIGSYAFKGCSELTSITIPDSVTSIGNNAFMACKKLMSINVSENNKEFSEIDGVLFNKDKTELLMYPRGKGDTYTVPNGVTSIGDSAFESSYLKSITIPDGVTSIGKNVFVFCKLTSITIPDSVTSIGNCAFYLCSDLTSITILNPNCEIYDNGGTISNSNNNVCSYNGTIYGYENSTAQAYAEKYGYKFEALSETPATKVIAGDANCDGKVSIADATAILQHLGNQDKYGLSAEGLKNADVDETDGVSTNDALVIQMVDAKLLTVEQLPLKK